MNLNKIFLIITLVSLGTVSKGQTAFEMIDKGDLESLESHLYNHDESWIGDAPKGMDVDSIDALSYSLINGKWKAAELIYRMLEQNMVLENNHSRKLKKKIINQAYYTSIDLDLARWSDKLLKLHPDFTSDVFDCECAPINLAIRKNANDHLAVMFEGIDVDSLPYVYWFDLMENAIEAQNQDAFTFLFFMVHREFYFYSVNENFFTKDRGDYIKNKKLEQYLYSIEKVIRYHEGLNDDTSNENDDLVRSQNDRLLNALVKRGSLDFNKHFLELPMASEGVLLFRGRRINLSHFKDVYERPTDKFLTVYSHRKLKYTLISYIELNFQSGISDDFIREDLVKLRDAFLERNHKNLALVCQELLLEYFGE